MSEDAAEIVRNIEAVFRRIETTAMAGVPLLNTALKVEAADVRETGDGWLVALVTPWFMNLMLMPRANAATPAPAGTKSLVALPGGAFEFIQAHDDALGPYRLCSLFSPMFEFADQDAAVATAREILELVCAGAEADDEDRDMVAIWQGRLPEPPQPKAAPARLSRRSLFGLPPGDERPPAVSPSAEPS